VGKGKRDIERKMNMNMGMDNSVEELCKSMIRHVYMLKGEEFIREEMQRWLETEKWIAARLAEEKKGEKKTEEGKGTEERM
jgi:hypothetical protein